MIDNSSLNYALCTFSFGPTKLIVVIPNCIPNSAVKPLSADDTTWVTAWESRTPPDLIFQPQARPLTEAGFFISIESRSVSFNFNRKLRRSIFKLGDFNNG